MRQPCVIAAAGPSAGFVRNGSGQTGRRSGAKSRSCASSERASAVAAARNASRLGGASSPWSSRIAWSTRARARADWRSPKTGRPPADALTWRRVVAASRCQPSTHARSAGVTVPRHRQQRPRPLGQPGRPVGEDQPLELGQRFGERLLCATRGVSATRLSGGGRPLDRDAHLMRYGHGEQRRACVRRAGGMLTGRWQAHVTRPAQRVAASAKKPAS